MSFILRLLKINFLYHLLLLRHLSSFISVSYKKKTISSSIITIQLLPSDFNAYQFTVIFILSRLIGIPLFIALLLYWHVSAIFLFNFISIFWFTCSSIQIFLILYYSCCIPFSFIWTSFNFICILSTSALDL